jgi:3-oxoadipate enol-lactonase
VAELEPLEQLLDEAGVTELCGHSFGAAVTIELALRRPERFRALVLTNPLMLGRSANIPSWPTAVERAKADDLDGARAAWLGDALFAELDPDTREEVRQIVADYRGGHWRGRTTTGFRFADPLPLLTRLEMPVLVVSAARDLPSFRAMAEDYARALPRARLEVLDAAHMAPSEVPERFNELLREFFQR